LDSPTPVPAVPPGPAPLKGNPGTAALVAVVNGVLIGVGSVYLTTHSALITMTAAVSAVILGSLTLLSGS
jgi:hypothetical protein